MFDKRITLGNILTIIGMAVAGVGAFYTQKAEVAALRMETHDSVAQLHSEIKVQGARVDYIQSDTQRRLGRIENKLDTLLGERP